MRIWTILVAMLAALFLALPAQACRGLMPFQPADARKANVVAVGRITNYEIVRDPAARERWKQLPASLKHYDAAGQEIVPTQFGSDYARFDITVDSFLAGDTAKTLSVVWDNASFALPEELPAGPMLVALVNDPSRSLGVPAAEAGSWTVLQSLCSRAFLFPVESQEAEQVRSAL